MPRLVTQPLLAVKEAAASGPSNHFSCRSIALARKRCGRGAHAKAGRMPALPTVARRAQARQVGTPGEHPEECHAPCREASGGSIGVNLKSENYRKARDAGAVMVAHGEPAVGQGRGRRASSPGGGDTRLRCRPVDALSPRFGATNT